MAKSQLSANQKIFLSFIDGEKLIYDLFYLTGGIALSEFYLQHRYSEDLDFFSEKEFKTKDIVLFLNSKKNSLETQRLNTNNHLTGIYSS